MSNYSFSEIAMSQYIEWQSEDKKTLKKINNLLKDISRNGANNGIGKPEPLKYRPGYSRRIDDANRLVYDIHDDVIEIISCKGHYEY